MSSGRPAEGALPRPPGTAASARADAPAPPARATQRARTIVVGLGNPILGDDGVGWSVLDVVGQRLGEPPADDRLDLVRLAVGGLRLMERLVGYERAILVDAVMVPGRETGTVTTCRLSDLPPRAGQHVDSSHDAPLTEALAAGRSLGAELPDEVLVVGVAIEVTGTFGDRLSEEVARAVPVAAERVLELLGAGSGTTPGAAPRATPVGGGTDGRRQSEGPPVPNPSALPRQ